MRAGLVSVTFRRFGIEEIVRLMDRARLTAVEWGGDVHVTDPRSACEAKRLCDESGIKICSLGSYFRVTQDTELLKKSVELADMLGTDMIRIWCGAKGSGELDEAARARVIDALNECCITAEGQLLSLEFHGGTLTDSLESVKRLIDETVSFKNLRFHWQPRWDWPEADNMKALETIKDRIGHMHVFCWEHGSGGITRKPLSDGEQLLKDAFSRCDADVLIEFVRNDSPEAFFEDAEALNRMIKG